MNSIDLAQLDLNLLVALDVLLEERSVTRAARRLHRTQSAVSHALGRLREALGDPLLVRIGGEMRPTPRAARLASELPRALHGLRRLLGEDEGFDPATTDRLFTLVGPDFAAAILPGLAGRAAAEAPGASVELLLPPRGLYRDVADGRFDLGLVPPPQARVEGLVLEPAARLTWAVFARRCHPALADWGLAAWAAHPHLRVRTGSEGESPVDRAARAAGVRRRGGPYLPHFMLAPAILAATDALMTVPRQVLAGQAERFGLVALECPVGLEPIPLSLAWSAARSAEPGSVWFRGLVREAARRTFAEPASRPGSTRPPEGKGRRRSG